MIFPEHRQIIVIFSLGGILLAANRGLHLLQSRQEVLSPSRILSEISNENAAKAHISRNHNAHGSAPDNRVLDDDVMTQCRPRHIHLSIGSEQNLTHSSMIVSFSFLPECARQVGSSAVGAVEVGVDAQDMPLWFVGDVNEAQSYNASLTRHQLKLAKHGETHYYSDVIYHIEVRGLKPGTQYHYRCLLVVRDSNQIISQSDDWTLLTPPAPGHWYAPPLDRSVKFAVLGDLAARPHSRETVKNLEEISLQGNGKDSREQTFHSDHNRDIDCILLAGDLSYADGDHSIWDDWMDMMGEHTFFKTVPVQVALGNHDLDHKDTLEIGTAYEKRFRMPQVKPAIRNLAPNDLFFKGETPDMYYFQAKSFLPYEYGNAYYSFIFGPSKHIVLSSYSSFLPGSIQHDWLLSELERIDRSITPWIIVMLHCPLYSTFHDHKREIFMTEARVHLEPLFVRHRVNFVVAGHLHSYMRTVPMIDSKPDPRGPIHIIQGNGGRQANEPYINNTVAEEWIKIRDHSMYGYGTLELFNRTHARWKWVKTGFNSEDEGGLHGRFQPDFSLNDDVWVTNQFYVDDEPIPGESLEM